ncbi:MAG: NAD(+)/NADH kinase [Lachnospiraceae bacterium]|nr:NAD(+)/NADH kinase [Lachnospiraceae bacterium]
MNKFYIVTNRDKDPQLETTNYICEFLKEHGREVTVLSRESLGKYAVRESREHNPLQIPEDTDCILVLGGDGTLLQTARDTVELGIPLLGINLGTLGFLAEVEKAGIPEALEHLIADEYETEERMLLTGKVLRNGEEICSAHALNDVVVNRCGRLMVLSYEVFVNGQKLNRYQADGMIVATPTGSTGYNMSAGGPIVAPGAQLMVMTPICPHTLNTRSIVLSAQDRVEIVIAQGRDEQVQEAEINFDGGLTQKLMTGDRVVMQRSEQTIKLIHMSKVSFLETLHRKMSES